MIFEVIIVFLSLITLIILHELGHFVLAKRFGVKVEEFGVFLPPRLFGKKVGETIYSVNLIPLGAFVKVKGEEGKEEGGNFDPTSFSSKPVWQRALIIAGGVVAFWVVAAILFSFVMTLGFQQAVPDDYDNNLKTSKVMIAFVSPNSPAEEAGLKIGDIIKGLKSLKKEISTVNKIEIVQGFIEESKGENVTLLIQRGRDVFETTLVPRLVVPENEGPIGIILTRVVEKSYPWYYSPIKGVEETWRVTKLVVSSLLQLVGSVISGKGVPAGAQLMGPVGIASLMTQFVQFGLSSYLHFLGVLSIYLAIFNILPIPALDGGKLLFLAIEKVKGKPVSQKLEQRITAFFFAALLSLLIVVTIKDVIKLLQ